MPTRSRQFVLVTVFVMAAGALAIAVFGAGLVWVQIKKNDHYMAADYHISGEIDSLSRAAFNVLEAEGRGDDGAHVISLARETGQIRLTWEEMQRIDQFVRTVQADGSMSPQEADATRQLLLETVQAHD